MTEEEATRRADTLLKSGDALGSKSAEGRRLLRECRRWRRIAQECREKQK